MPPFAVQVEPLLSLMTHQGQMARPVGKSSTRQHLQALAARGDLRAKSELVEPAVPSPMRYLVEWWHEIGAGRGSGAWGPAGVTWQDIAGWSAVTGTEISPMEAMVVLRMDRTFLSAAQPPEPTRSK
jgi:hypothetical protein